MSKYYLMPCKLKRLPNSTRYDPDQITLFAGTSKRADEASLEYERALNDGKTWKEAMSEDAWFVVAEPFHVSRDYRDFNDWKCNREDT